MALMLNPPSTPYGNLLEGHMQCALTLALCAVLEAGHCAPRELRVLR